MTCPRPFVEEEGECRFTVPLTVVDEYGHGVENDFAGRHGCPHGKEHFVKAPMAIQQGLIEGVRVEPEPVVPAEVSALIPKDGNVSGLTVVLVGLVLASGLALKLVPAWLDHRLKKAQTDSKKPDCKTAHGVIEARTLAVEEQVRVITDRGMLHEARIAALEQKEETHDP